MPPVQEAVNASYRVMGAPLRPVGVLLRLQVGFEYRLKHEQADVCATRSRMQGMPNGRNLPGCFFGIRTCRTGFGVLVPSFRSRTSSPSQRPTPYDSMSAKVSPSTPAEPPLRRTRLQASARKSSRHTLSISAWKRRPGSSLAFACNTVWSFRTFSDPGRLSPVVTPFILPVSLSNQGSFPPPALPGILGHTGLSATLPARPVPRGLSGWRVPRHQPGLPVLRPSPLPCVLPPIPRRNLSVHVSLASRPVTAFPVIQAGRLPH